MPRHAGMSAAASGWRWLFVLLLAAVVLGNNLDDYAALTEHEIVVGGVAHQMVREGTWGQLLIGDRNWLEKPPLPHWLGAVSLSLLGAPPGEVEREWAVRLPSVLEGLAVLLIVGLMARRWYGEAVGLMTVLLGATTHGLFIYSRLAENDMVLCLIVVAGLASLARTLESAPGSRAFIRWRFTFWVMVGAANLTKGALYGDLLMGSALFAYWLWQRDWWLPLRLLSPSGILVAVTLALAWPLWVWHRGEIDVLLDWWFNEMGGRFDKGYYLVDQPLYYYLEALVGHLLPWTPLLLLSLPLAWRRQRAHAQRGRDAARRPFNRERFLLCWCFAPLVLLTLAPHRHHHYILPTLPAQAILLAAALPIAWDWLSAHKALHRVWLPAFLLLVAAGLVGAMLLLPASMPDVEPFLLPFGLAGLLGALTAAAAFRFGCRAWLPASALFGSLLALFFVFGSGLIPRNDLSAADTAFFMRVNEAVPPEARLVLTGGQPVARFDFYVGRAAETYWYPEILEVKVAPGETLYVVTRGDEEPVLERLGTVERLYRSPLSRYGPEPGMLYGLYRVEVAE